MGLIRLLLALSVVVAHTSQIPGLPTLDPDVAVRVFFCISGFYMTLVLNEKYPNNRKGNWTFAWNRVLRLYPTYGLVLVAALAGKLSTGKFESFSGLSPIALAEIVTAHITMLGQDVIVFCGINQGTGSLYLLRNFQSAPLPAHSLLLIPPAWSLSLELMFYALAPMIVRRGWKVTLFLVAISWSLRIAGSRYLGLIDDPWTYRFFPFELGTFLVGSLAYYAYSVLRDRVICSAPSLLGVYGLILAGFLGSAMLKIPSLVVLTFAAFLPIVFHLTRHSRFDRLIGELSYSIYLSHLLIAMVLHKVHLEGGFPVAIASAGVSLVIVRWIDQPIDKLRQRLAENGTIPHAIRREEQTYVPCGPVVPCERIGAIESMR